MSQKILVTGVYGLIAGEIYRHLDASPEQYSVYGLARRRQASERVPEERRLEVPEDRFFLSDLSDLGEVTRAVEGMDVVVHYAADPSGRAGFESVLQSNIIGAYNVFEACMLAHVKRVVFASTIQVSMGYHVEEPYGTIVRGEYSGAPEDIPVVTHKMPNRTRNIYASSKAWGEALARSYVDSHGLSCICIRVGWIPSDDRPPKPRAGYVWCSLRDMARLVECCITAPETVRFDIFYGMSKNKHLWVDIEHAREVVGYVPLDNAEDYLQDESPG